MIWLPIYERLLLRRLPIGSRLLDLCCGSGQLTRRLAAKGFQVTGLEGSTKILRYARRNAPGVSFTHQDARHFNLPTIFHGALSAFDSLNHVMSLPELTATFSCVYNALADGGLFLFDLNNEDGYVRHWCGNNVIVDDDLVCVLSSDYDPPHKFAWANTTIFRRIKGDWRRSDFVLTQRCHEEADVRAALKEAGFTNIRFYEQGRNLTTKNADGRIFYLARKPGNFNR
jgi:SAM-dependent methyltransferase